MKIPSSAFSALALLTLPALAALPQQGRGGALRQAADGRAAQDARTQAEEENRKLAETYFEIADYDKNGWISFREARDSLDIDRNRYLVYDADLDGRVTVEEYSKISLETARRYGVFKAPRPDPNDPEAQALLESLLDGEEAEPEEEELEPFPTDAGNVLELFGRVRPRVIRDNAVPEPEQLVGPVPSFHRLDYDWDGGISRADLSLLLTGAGIDVRPSAIIAAIDMDGDGALSAEEFYASMGDTPPLEPAPREAAAPVER